MTQQHITYGGGTQDEDMHLDVFVTNKWHQINSHSDVENSLFSHTKEMFNQIFDTATKMSQRIKSQCKV